MKKEKPTLLITGVSTGIGFAAAQRMITAGWQVFGTVRSVADAARVREAMGPGLHPLLLDVCAPAEAYSAFAAELADALAGRALDGLVHNAGVAIGGPLAFQAEAEMRNMLDVNVMGVFKLTQAVLDLMGPGSRMVMMSSVSGRLVTPFVGGYAASKFALEALTDAYRNELGMLGIRVVSIQPGPVKTPIWEKARKHPIRYPDSPYADILSIQDKLIEQTERNALPVERIAELVWGALTKEKTKTRYLAVSNPWLVRLAKYLPDTIKDKLVLMRLKGHKKW